MESMAKEGCDVVSQSSGHTDEAYPGTCNAGNNQNKREFKKKQNQSLKPGTQGSADEVKAQASMRGR